MKKTIVRILFSLVILGALLGYVGYQMIFGVNTVHTESKMLFIPTGSDMTDVVRALDDQEIIDNTSSFERVADLMKYGHNVRPGRYKIATGLSNRSLVSQLRIGQQEPVSITISTARTLDQVAGLISRKLESDSVTILRALLDPEFLQANNLTEESAISMIIPNTYQVYWSISGGQLAKRLSQEYQSFWKANDRTSKQEELGMTRQEVSTLASIVEKESIQSEERPIIAGLYLNRLKENIHLQADPTVVFGLRDFTIRRVLTKHLEQDTPYNTYLHAGLPPGPICMPSIASIDAVLSADKHDYIFMCAKPGYNGAHNFAVTNAEHERNASIYHRWLDKEGIKG